MTHLGMMFRLHVSCVHKVIHDMLPVLHVVFVPQYIIWPTLAKWRNLRGTFPEWPRVVGIMDCTPFCISKPKGILYVEQYNVVIVFFLFPFITIHTAKCQRKTHIWQCE